MSRLPAPENPLPDTEPHPLIQSSLDSKSVASDERPKKSKGTVLISSISKDEPIVTRRELWSYYRELCPTKYLGRDCLQNIETVYYNGDNVCIPARDTFQRTILKAERLGCWSKWLLHDPFPEPSHSCWL